LPMLNDCVLRLRFRLYFCCCRFFRSVFALLNLLRRKLSFIKVSFSRTASCNKTVNSPCPGLNGVSKIVASAPVAFGAKVVVSHQGPSPRLVSSNLPVQHSRKCSLRRHIAYIFRVGPTSHSMRMRPSNPDQYLHVQA
jgi:hypothetical protein